MKHASIEQVEHLAKTGHPFSAPGQRTADRAGASGAGMATSARRGFSKSWTLARMIRAFWLKI